MKNQYYDVLSHVFSKGYFLVTDKKVKFFYDNDRFYDITTPCEDYFNTIVFQKVYIESVGVDYYSREKALHCIKKAFNCIKETMLQYMVVNERSFCLFKNVHLTLDKVYSKSVINSSVNILNCHLTLVNLHVSTVDRFKEITRSYPHTNKNNLSVFLVKTDSTSDWYKHSINKIESITKIKHIDISPFSRYDLDSMSYFTVWRTNTGRYINLSSDDVITFFVS